MAHRVVIAKAWLSFAALLGAVAIAPRSYGAPAGSYAMAFDEGDVASPAKPTQ